MDLDRPDAPGLDDVGPLWGGDDTAIRVAKEPPVASLQSGRHGVTQCAERTRMAVNEHFGTEAPTDRETHKTSDQGWIRDDDASWSSLDQIARRRDSAEDVADGCGRTPLRFGREIASRLAVERGSDFLGATADGTPGHERDTEPGTAAGGAEEGAEEGVGGAEEGAAPGCGSGHRAAGSDPSSGQHARPGDEAQPSSTPLPGVSVVIASRNRRHLLTACVGAVVADPATREVIVVLDGSTDGSLELLEQLAQRWPSVKPVLTEQQGQMGALDIGVQRSTSDVVLLMDDDVLAHSGMVSGHARHHSAHPRTVVLGYMPVEGSHATAVTSRLYADEYEAHCRRLETKELEVLSGLWLGNVSVRREHLLRVGVRSKEFPVRWHADTDLGRRLATLGLTGVFDRKLRASHLHAQSNDSYLRDALERGVAVELLHEAYGSPDASLGMKRATEDVPRFLLPVISLLAGEGRARPSSRALMGLSQVGQRVGFRRMPTRCVQLARRIMMVSGARGARGQESEGAVVAS